MSSYEQTNVGPFTGTTAHVETIIYIQNTETVFSFNSKEAQLAVTYKSEIFKQMDFLQPVNRNVVFRKNNALYKVIVKMYYMKSNFPSSNSNITKTWKSRKEGKAFLY